MPTSNTSHYIYSCYVLFFTSFLNHFVISFDLLECKIEKIFSTFEYLAGDHASPQSQSTRYYCTFYLSNFTNLSILMGLQNKLQVYPFLQKTPTKSISKTNDVIQIYLLKKLAFSYFLGCIELFKQLFKVHKWRRNSSQKQTFCCELTFSSKTLNENLKSRAKH